MRPRQNSVVFNSRVCQFAVIGLIVGQFVYSSTDWALLVRELTADAVKVNHLAEVKVVERIRVSFDDPALCMLHLFIQNLLSNLKTALYMLRQLYFLL